MKRILLTLLLLLFTATTVLADTTYYESYKYDIEYDVPRKIKQQDFANAFYLLDEWSYEITEKHDKSFPISTVVPYKQFIVADKLGLLPLYFITNPDSTFDEKYNLFFNDIDGFYSEIDVFARDITSLSFRSYELFIVRLKYYTRYAETTEWFKDSRNVDMYICSIISMIRFIKDPKLISDLENICLELSQKYITEEDVYIPEYLTEVFQRMNAKRLNN